MNITPLTIYAMHIADGISIFSAIASCLLGIGLLFIFLNASIEDLRGEELQQWYAACFMRKARLGFIVAIALSILIPDSKTLAMMWMVPEIANSKAVQQDFPEIYNLAVEKLKEQLAPKK